MTRERIRWKRTLFIRLRIPAHTDPLNRPATRPAKKQLHSDDDLNRVRSVSLCVSSLISARPLQISKPPGYLGDATKREVNYEEQVITASPAISAAGDADGPTPCI